MGRRKKLRLRGVGRNRPAWGRRQVVAWTAMASATVLGYQAGMTWLTLGSDKDGVSQVLVAVCGALLAVGAAWWLGSLQLSAFPVVAGAVMLGLAGPNYVDDQVLATAGHTVLATVSDVQVSHGKNEYIYTVRFDGVQRAMIVHNPDSPIVAGSTLRVVADPLGRVPTEEPSAVDRVGPLPVALGGALLMIGGFALAAGADQPHSTSGWEHSWPYRVGTRRQERRRARHRARGR
jgi:hypothetical protein